MAYLMASHLGEKGETQDPLFYLKDSILTSGYYLFLLKPLDLLEFVT